MSNIEDKGCRCGCGLPVGRKSSYRPGHDARHAGQVGREAAARYADGEGLWDLDEFYSALPSERLVKKAKSVAEREVFKATAKRNRALHKASKDAGFAEGIVTKGRWEYPARMTKAGKVERNTSRDGSGSWVPAENPESWKAA